MTADRDALAGVWDRFWGRRDKLKEKYAGRSSGMGDALTWFGMALCVAFGGGALAFTLGMVVSPWIGIGIGLIVWLLFSYCILRFFLCAQP